MYVLVCVQTDYQAVALLSPLGQLGDQVLLKFGAGASEVVPLRDEESMMLLVGSAAFGVLVVARIVAADHSGLSVITLESHNSPSP